MASAPIAQSTHTLSALDLHAQIQPFDIILFFV
jgi:hypothetical protein